MLFCLLDPVCRKKHKEKITTGEHKYNIDLLFFAKLFNKFLIHVFHQFCFVYIFVVCNDVHYHLMPITIIMFKLRIPEEREIATVSLWPYVAVAIALTVVLAAVVCCTLYCIARRQDTI